MHRLDGFSALCAAAYVGLVRDDNQEKFRCLKPCATGRHVFVEFEILEMGRRMWMTIPDDSPVEHSIAIQEYCASRYFMLSHFVSASFSLG
jgi:hypothetical protein